MPGSPGQKVRKYGRTRQPPWADAPDKRKAVRPTPPRRDGRKRPNVGTVPLSHLQHGRALSNGQSHCPKNVSMGAWN